MNKWQKEVLGNRNVVDEQVLKELKTSYRQALKSIDDKIAQLLAREDKENLQSIIYQVEYQKALKSQINTILDDLNNKQFNTLSEYLEQSYEDGFIGTMYDLQKQGVPLVMPIDEQQVVRALKTNSKLSKGLYEALGEDMQTLKRKVRNEISRGISQNFSYDQIALNLARQTNIGYNNAVRIARTESHRITQEATMDAQYKAKEKGADIVKQWDSSLDSRTRESHAVVDGEIRELDELFSNGLMFPGDSANGSAAEVINCRCALLQRAKWALDEAELEELKKRAEYFGLDKTENYNDYKKKYLKAVEEIKHPFKDKEFHMDPSGNLIEGSSPGHTSYKMDIPSDKVYTMQPGESYNMAKYQKLKDEGYEAIVSSNGKINVIDQSKLETIDAVEDLKKTTFSLNEDGTYHFGKIKDQAEYQIDIPENQILNIDIKKNSIKDDFYEFTEDWEIPEAEASILSKQKAIIENMPDDMQKELLTYTQSKYGHFDTVKEMAANINPEDLDDYLKIKNYKALKVIGTDDIDDFIKVFDDKVITKTKKSKLEDLTDKLGKEQKKLGKLDNKTYSGIWKDDVQLSDYAEKKASIQAKKDYYNQSIANMKSQMDSMPATVQKKWKQQINDFEKHLDELDEFEKLGKEYEKQLKKIEKLQNDADKLKPKVIENLGDAYSQERKDAAYWFNSKNGSTEAANKAYLSKVEEVWQNSSKAEKESAYRYTYNYSPYNEPLRGIEYGTNKYLGVGNVDLNKIGVNYKYNSFKPGEMKKNIDNLTNMINRSSYDHDIWVQRGVDYNGMDKFLGVDINDLYGSQKQLEKLLLGKEATEYGFMSTATAKGKGFTHCDIIMNIYAPKGTKMLYVEPFSKYGAELHDNSSKFGLKWNGKTKQKYFGNEAEMLFQRNTTLRITKVEKSGEKLYLDFEVISQNA